MRKAVGDILNGVSDFPYAHNIGDNHPSSFHSAQHAYASNAPTAIAAAPTKAPMPTVWCVPALPVEAAASALVEAEADASPEWSCSPSSATAAESVRK